MKPVLLESTDYHDLRSTWFRASHEPGLFVVEGRSDIVQQELRKLSMHWQDQAIRLVLDDAYHTLPFIYQLNPVHPIDDLVACKNALLRFHRAGWAPGPRKWILVEVVSGLHPADLGAIHHLLYRQKLKDVSVLLFFHQYPVSVNLPQHVSRLAISLVRDTPEHTRRLLNEQLRMAGRHDEAEGKQQRKALALYNRLAWILLCKSDNHLRYRACFRFFSQNAIFQQLSASQQAILWFELGQLLTKNGDDYDAARECYAHARAVLEHEELAEVYRIGKEAALDNGEALIEMQEGHISRAIELEKRAGMRIRELPPGPDRHVFQIQTALNIAGLQIRAGLLMDAETTLIAGEKLCTGVYSGWLGHILQLKMSVYQQLGEQELEYQMLIQVLRMKTGSIPSKLLQRSIEMAGVLIQQGEEERAAEVYRLLIAGLPATNLKQIRLIRQALSSLGTESPAATATQHQLTLKLELQLDTWEQFKYWHEGRESGWTIHS
ncbi:hypothetical protein M3629_20530 [Paenibacillus polysaccharolyticus]|uniref:hypothetical protein n=1 Tax=Paenibacillus polysaccharolyticus TaxID=582692 RepID=UPI00203D10AD|nr:hypothetical protein [Paenibacillus polysaccharolyticus]MCM3135172.1 hypothetical protein [Paenibacillus polysaccharolyticus]